MLDNRPRCGYAVSSVSSKSMQGISSLCDTLVHVIMDNETYFPGIKLPRSWIVLGDSIASKKDDVPFISYRDFTTLAEECNVANGHVKSALRYLQSAGIVLHYEDYKKNSDLKQYVFSNANLLLALFGLVFNHNYYMDEIRFVWKNASILKLPEFDFEMLRKNLREKAVIGEGLLKCFWDSIGIKGDVFRAILSLLEKFDLCYEVPIKEEDEGTNMPKGRHFMFPNLLKETVPVEVATIWPKDIPEDILEYRLSLQFMNTFIPFGFLEKVSVRINPYLEYRLNWKWGLVAFCSDGQDLIHIQAIQDGKQSSTLMFSTRVLSNRESMARHVLLLLVAVTNRVLTHYYPGVLAFWFVHCSHCIELSRSREDIIPDTFPADNIVMANDLNTMVKCSNCSGDHILKLKEVFPPNSSKYRSSLLLSSFPICHRHIVLMPFITKCATHILQVKHQYRRQMDTYII